jgi:hypothetical protein
MESMALQVSIAGRIPCTIPGTIATVDSIVIAYRLRAAFFREEELS